MLVTKGMETCSFPISFLGVDARCADLSRLAPPVFKEHAVVQTTWSSPLEDAGSTGMFHSSSELQSLEDVSVPAGVE